MSCFFFRLSFLQGVKDLGAEFLREGFALGLFIGRIDYAQEDAQLPLLVSLHAVEVPKRRARWAT